MKIVLLFAWILLIPGSAFAIENGSELFVRHCASCHKMKGPPQNAPPVFGVVNHVKQRFPGRWAFVERIVSWVKEPRLEDALMPGAIRRFGLMPKLDIPENEVRLIAEYLYDGKPDLPEWYIRHYEEEHGHKPVQ